MHIGNEERRMSKTRMSKSSGVEKARPLALFVRRWAPVLICAVAWPGSLWAQGAADKPATNSSTSQNQDGGGPLGFSIESEMLTYRALESNSEAVACDIAAYLRGGSASFGNSTVGSVCTVSGGANNKASIVILPFDQTQFNDFRMWRADMQIMNELRTRALVDCPATQPIKVTERGAAASAVSATPAGSALSAAQTAFGLVSSESSVTAVGGTIQDQAFMDGVARDLRNQSLTVMMPSAYVPDSLSPIDASRSPFLQSLQKLYQARRCLIDLGSKGDASVDQLIADMDTYLASLTGNTVAAPKAAAPAPAKPADASTGAQGAGNSAATTPSSSTHLISVLSADSLAQRLGVNPDTGLLTDQGALLHVLLLKALESGGTIEKKANILGTKIRYSGGSVATYAMFTMDGMLECSGNVYEYGGSLPAKDFVKGLRNYNPDPSKQFIIQRGSCRALPAR